MPWMDVGTDLYGLTFHYAGRRIPLTGPWTEPGSTPPAGVAYLNAYFQAPLAYGESFTAYTQHCRNLFRVLHRHRHVESFVILVRPNPD